MSSSPLENATQAPLFRPSKKRKIYRSRAPEDSDEPPSEPITPLSPSKPSSPIPAPAQSIDELIASAASAEAGGGSMATDEVGELSIAEILRLRKKIKGRRIGGVEFREEKGGGYGRDEEMGEEVRGEGEAEGSEGGGLGTVRKFAKQTGRMGDVDRHMMAYIDSELAKRQLTPSSFKSTQEGMVVVRSGRDDRTASPFVDDGHERHEWGKGKKTEVQRQPATLGKLLEIDLGEEVRDGNVKRTEVAWRRLGGEEVVVEDGKKTKVRLGRDGKPWRGGRKRRASEDIRRDKAVEEILRENRLEIYDEPAVEESTPNDDQAADDRIAEAFRKEFLDAVNARQRKKVAPAQQPSRGPGAKKEEEVLKGPKLGGSRSARAAMRETMLKNAKK